MKNDRPIQWTRPRPIQWTGPICLAPPKSKPLSFFISLVVFHVPCRFSCPLSFLINSASRRVRIPPHRFHNRSIRVPQDQWSTLRSLQHKYGPSARSNLLSSQRLHVKSTGTAVGHEKRPAHPMDEADAYPLRSRIHVPGSVRPAREGPGKSVSRRAACEKVSRNANM